MVALATLAIAPTTWAAEPAAAQHAPEVPALLAQAASPSAGCGADQLSFLQRRIIEKAEQGPAALRQYIWITRSLFGLDMRESLEFVERHRAERAACERRA